MERIREAAVERDWLFQQFLMKCPWRAACAEHKPGGHSNMMVSSQAQSPEMRSQGWDGSGLSLGVGETFVLNLYFILAELVRTCYKSINERRKT
eukprot:scaffold154752_cov23-Tisochrysis_lutea.AAC.1